MLVVVGLVVAVASASLFHFPVFLLAAPLPAPRPRLAGVARAAAAATTAAAAVAALAASASASTVALGPALRTFGAVAFEMAGFSTVIASISPIPVRAIACKVARFPAVEARESTAVAIAIAAAVAVVPTTIALGPFNRQAVAVELVAVHILQRVLRIFLVLVLHEREAVFHL